MTEREKMLAGELYDCGDAELLSQWHKAKNLVRSYNNINSENTKEKEKILSELLGGMGKNLWITAPFFVDYGNNIYFGNTSNTPIALQSSSGINKYFSCSPSNTFNTSNFIFNIVSLKAII